MEKASVVRGRAEATEASETVTHNTARRLCCLLLLTALATCLFGSRVRESADLPDSRYHLLAMNLPSAKRVRSISLRKTGC